jgi:hypothetical protein
LIIEAASIFETSVNFYQTTRHNTQDSHLQSSERQEQIKVGFIKNIKAT